MILVIFYYIQLFARINIFLHIGKKHGQGAVKLIRSYETYKRKLSKVNEDIKFIKCCKSENLLPKFAKVKLAIKNGTYKLQNKIVKLVMESEL